MCGIVGVAGDVSFKHEAIFKTMLCLDVIRGPHSTGVLSLDNQKGSLDYVKIAALPWDLFRDKGFEKMFRKKHRVLVGHNRWATRGAVTSKNAHPFLHKHIAGVHNGTLVNQSLLDDHKKFEVDSENIIFQLSKDSIEDAMKKVHGAYCLVWVDENKKLLHMLRNKDRPLFLSTGDEGKIILWASEPWMIEVAAQKENLAVTKPVLIDEDVLYTYDVSSVHIKRVDDGTKVLGHKPAYTAPVYSTAYQEDIIFRVTGEVMSSYGGYSYTEGKVCSGKYKGEMVKVYAINHPEIKASMAATKGVYKGKLCSRYKEAGKKDFSIIVTVVTVEPITKNPPVLLDNVTPIKGEKFVIMNGLKTSIADFFRKTNKGCGWCSAVPDVEEAETLLFNYTGSEFLCKGCQEDVPEAASYFY